MFRLSINIGGAFDLYVASSASRTLRSAAPSAIPSNGNGGGVVGEPLRTDRTGDFGRVRNLILLTESSIEEEVRAEIREELERLLGSDFDRLMAAKNRDAVAAERKRVYAVCERLEEALILGHGPVDGDKVEEPHDSGAEFPEPSEAPFVGTNAVSEPTQGLKAKLYTGRRMPIRIAVASTVAVIFLAYFYFEFIERNAISGEIGRNVTNIQREISSDDGAIAALHTKIRKLETQVEQIQHEFSSDNGSIVKLHAAVRTLTSQLGEINSEFTSEKGSIQALNAGIATLDKRTTTLQNEFASERASTQALNTSIAALEWRTTALQNEFTSEEGSIQALSAGVATLDTRTTTLQNEFTSERASTQALNAGIATLDRRTTALQSEFTSENGSIGKIKSEIAGIGSHVSKLQMELTSRQGLIGTLESRVQNLNHETKAIRNDLTSEDGVVLELTSRIRHIEIQIRRLQNQFTSKEGPITILGNSVHHLSGRISELQNQFTADAGPISVLNDAMHRLERNVTRVQGQFISLRGPIANLENSVQRLERQITLLRNSFLKDDSVRPGPDLENTNGSGSAAADTESNESQTLAETSDQIGAQETSENGESVTGGATPPSSNLDGDSGTGVLQDRATSNRTPSHVPQRQEGGVSNPEGLDASVWREIQSVLESRGFSPGVIDGIPGDDTRTAIEEWQKSEGLQQTGVLSEKTIKKLLSKETTK